MKNKLIAIVSFCFIHMSLFGATDHYDNIGKIYAVVAVVAITLLGIAAFLFYLERRINSLEKQLEDE